MFLNASRYPESVVVVTYGSTSAFFFAFCQNLFRWFIPIKTHFLFDLLLDAPRKGVAGSWDRFKAWVFNRAISGAVIWGACDVGRYSEHHGLSREKLFFHPYHITIDDFGEFDDEEENGRYVFCGGNVGRDFKTVIEALGPLGIPVFIATQVPGIVELAREYPSVIVQPVTPGEFRSRIAKCTFVVEAHPDEGFFRTAGHQTMLNAMYFGKPVILADLDSAQGYVRDGVDGYSVAAGDVEALRSAAEKVWQDSALLDRLARRARRKARRGIYSTRGHMASIYRLALRARARTAGRPCTDDRYRAVELAALKDDSGP